jgi:hypothetical protein
MATPAARSGEPAHLMMKAAAIVQNCYVVRDLEEGCERFRRLYGIAPFVGGSIMELTEHVYRGRPAPSIELRAAFAQAGDINIELVEPVSSAPNPFNDMFPEGTEGFHHVAMFCADFAAACDHFTVMGHALVSEACLLPGIRVGFIDARKAIGHMIELYPESEIIRAVFRRIRDAADNWDGKNLIIPLG